MRLAPREHLADKRRRVGARIDVREHEARVRREPERHDAVVPRGVRGCQHARERLHRVLRTRSASARRAVQRGAGAHQGALHERLQHRGREARVDLAAEHGGRDVEAGADLALREAVDELRRVVRELAPVARARARARLGERVARHGAQVQQQRGHERRDERGGRAEPRLVHVGQAHARVQERRELRERGERRGEVAAGELWAGVGYTGRSRGERAEQTWARCE